MALPRLRPDTLAMTAMLAVLISLGPLSTDMYLPSLPGIAAHFARPPADVQLTLSAFLIGFACGQVVYGPLADRHGRKPVLLAGLAIFTVASALCAIAPSLDLLVGARFLQAAGASGSIVVARAIVRDLYSGDRAGAELARMGMIMGLVPAIAPVFGGVLEVAFGWRASFVATVLFAAATLAAVVAILPETIKAKAPDQVSPARIVATFREIWRSSGFRGYVMINACAYGGLFSFISGSSYVFQGHYGLSPKAFGFTFASAVVGYVGGTILAQRMVKSRGLEATIRLGVLFLAGGGVVMLASVLVGPGHPAEMLGPVIVYMVGVGLAFPQSIAGAMNPFGARAGAASSLLGICQMTFAAVVGIGVGHSVSGPPWPLAAFIAVLGVGALVVERLTRVDREGALKPA
jgi:MFS transporter, DHA1 family, multidrug resistance protein